MRHRIVAARMKWMTARETLQAKPAAAHAAVLGDSFERVRGTGRIEATMRTEPWADGELVRADKKSDHVTHEAAIFCQSLSNDARKSARSALIVDARAPMMMSRAGSSC